MSRKNVRVLGRAAGLAALMAVLAAGTALAATGSGDLGTNLGNELTSWGKPLLLALATLMGLPALARRNLGESLVVALIVIVLGGFVFAPHQITNVINSLWQHLAG